MLVALVEVDVFEALLNLIDTVNQFDLPADPIRVVKRLACLEVADPKRNLEPDFSEIDFVGSVELVVHLWKIDNRVLAVNQFASFLDGEQNDEKVEH